MVSEQEVLDYMRRKAYRPLTVAELGRVFLPGGKGMNAFKKLLRGMEEKGLIYQTRAARFGLPEQFNLFVGRVQGHAKGYAFLVPDNEGADEVFIGSGNLNGAMHNDRVAVRLLPDGRGKTREGEVVRVLKRGNSRLVGTLHKKRRFSVVVPDDPRLGSGIVVPRGRLTAARNGDKVVVELTAYPTPRTLPEGRVVEVLGQAGAPGMDMLVLCRRYDLPDDFGMKVLREAENIPAAITGADLRGRRDLRDWLVITIDGEDAKDLDDAVSLSVLPDGMYMLGVHIADVEHYVQEGGALDREALKRGTSVYLPGRVVPMLPPRLSSGICSLNPGEDRLTLSVLMTVGPEGGVREYELVPSVIRSRERMTYTAVYRMLEGDPEFTGQYRHLSEMLARMRDLCLVLRRRRLRNGAINFNLPETKVELDDAGRPVAVFRAARTVAEQIIEEFMLIANETVARHAAALGLPFIYRVHPKPDEEKVAALAQLLAGFGYNTKGLTRLEPAAFQAVLDAACGRREERLINAVMLRSMKQARYAPERSGHFGLASEYYTHFTSPIRRYPDLFIHRVLREAMANGWRLSAKRKAELQAQAEYAAVLASERERVAMEAEREAVELKKAAFMEDKVGNVYPGFISGVTGWGLYVELENTVEGLVHVRTLTDDFYLYDERSYTLTGRNTGKSYRLGDPVRVRVLRASVEDRLVEFELSSGD
ncbi:MAG TPA: ribonuclease R [Desulfotomaculum sp.]|nr:ribonuclease R [Desulfotomaculum sp.]